jgi:hypothetical protein
MLILALVDDRLEVLVCALPYLWDTMKPLLFEMRVKYECALYSLPAHDFEAHTVNQAELPLGDCQKSAQTRTVNRLIDPFDMRQR